MLKTFENGEVIGRVNYVGYNQIVRDVKSNKLINKPVTKEVKLYKENRIIVEERNRIISRQPGNFRCTGKCSIREYKEQSG